MTPDTCPYCGAPLKTGEYPTTWGCGSITFKIEGQYTQSPECARYVRTRISQLRRMAEQAFRVWDRLPLWDRLPPGRKTIRHAQQLARFRSACLREIERLRGGA